MNGCNSWFGLIIDLLGILFISTIIIFVIIFRKSFDPQAIGLIIIYSLRLQDNIFNSFIRLSEYENDMIGMERCIYYTDIPQKKADHCDNDENLISHN